MDIVFLRGHQQKAVQHATVLYFEAWENTSKVCELLQLIACEVTRESMLQVSIHTWSGGVNDIKRG